MRVVAIGEQDVLAGYPLAGVELIAAADARAAQAAWDGLGDDVGMVLLTPASRRALDGRLDDREVLWTALPD